MRYSPRLQPIFSARVRGFSLIEVLLAIVILGLGVISIAALFPAGIAQQQRSADDILGPLVANNALSIIRSKVRPEDFGTIEEFRLSPGAAVPLAPLPTLGGDWPWLRPSFILADDPATVSTGGTPIDDRGKIDIFSAYASNGIGVAYGTEFPGGYVDSFGAAAEHADCSDAPRALFGIPFNLQEHCEPPPVFIWQRERFYPQPNLIPESLASDMPGTDDPQPQYVWDCMFRRFQGRVQVSIFVYRISQLSGGAGRMQYFAPPSAVDPDLPPLPHMLEIVPDPVTYGSPWTPGWDAFGLTIANRSGEFSRDDDAFVFGNATTVPYNPELAEQSWQEPGQWLLDQNNNIHRVVSSTREDSDDDGETDDEPIRVGLVRPIPQLPVYGSGPTGGGSLFFDPFPAGDPLIPSPQGIENIVTHIWYIPRQVELDYNLDGTNDATFTLTPVFAMVSDL